MKKVMVLTYWKYREALVQTYTLPYVRLLLKHLPQGSEVILLTLEKAEDPMPPELMAMEQERLKAEGITWLAHQYRPFGIRSLLGWLGLIPRLAGYVRHEKVTHLHAWCTPAGGLGYLLSRLTGRPLVVDSYEPHAESMVENGTWSENGLAFRILFRLEKWQSQRATAVIALTEGMQRYALEKYQARFDRYFVKPACVDFDQFDHAAPRDPALVQKLELNHKVVAVYAGKLGGIYLEEEVFDWLKAAFDYWGDRFRAVLLTPNPKAEVDRWCAQKAIPENAVSTQFVAHHEVANYLRLGDFAINPVKPVPSKRYCTSIKDGEYWAMGLPVMLPKGISDDSEIIARHRIGVVVETLQPESYQPAMAAMDQLLQEDRLALRKRIVAVGQQYRHFNIAEKIYQELYA